MASRSLMPFSRNMPMSRWSEDMDPFLAMRREMNRLFDDAFSLKFIGLAKRDGGRGINRWFRV